MAGWRDEVLREFRPGVAGLTVAADPDDLLLEAGILAELQSRGFEVTAFEDRVAFGCGSFASAVQRGPGGAASGMARAT